jgi:hypothetical protein
VVYGYGGFMPDSIAQRLETLPKLVKTELNDLWREVFLAHPPSRLRRKLMVPILAYRLQEKAFGSMSAKTRGRLQQVARLLESESKSSVASVPSLKAGTRLVRQWREHVHLVNVEDSGYEYQGTRYKSLSQIARLITGTRWSGPLFFGIKPESTTSPSTEAQ